MSLHYGGTRPLLARKLCTLGVLALGGLGVMAQSPPAKECRSDVYLEAAELADKQGRYADALVMVDSALIHASAEKNPTQEGNALVIRSRIHQQIGDYNAAFSDLFQALDRRERTQDQLGLAEVNNSIGSIHHHRKDYDKARLHYARSLALYSSMGRLKEVAICLNNFGALVEGEGNPEEAITFHRRSLAIWRDLRSESWMAVSYMHIGICMQLLQRTDSAHFYLDKSTTLLEGMKGTEYMLSLALRHLGENHRQAGRGAAALASCERSLRLGEDLKALQLQQYACECLYRTNEDLGRSAAALAYHKRFIALRDSVFGEENQKEMMRIELSHAFAQQHFADSLKQDEERLMARLVYEKGMARERERRNILLFGIFAVMGLAIGLWTRARALRRSSTAIRNERDRSEGLLLNILPKGIAEELKTTGQAQARDLDEVSILFTDFKDFTEISERLSAKDLVAEIHMCFTAFDGITAARGIEKIKTIGDAYMAAGGLPVPSANSARNTVLAALDMRDAILARAKERLAQGLPAFEMRIGVHTGPVVAGIVGVKKFAYDVWGDTVNIASRLETGSEPGCVNISSSTYQLVKDTPGLSFIPRGLVNAKGKGDLTMYFVDRA